MEGEEGIFPLGFEGPCYARCGFAHLRALAHICLIYNFRGSLPRLELGPRGLDLRHHSWVVARRICRATVPKSE